MAKVARLLGHTEQLAAYTEVLRLIGELRKNAR